MSDLHAQIMNLPVGTPGWAGNDLLLYKEGHKAARHAAAELALAHDARIRQLEEALEAVRRDKSFCCLKEERTQAVVLAALKEQS